MPPFDDAVLVAALVFAAAVAGAFLLAMTTKEQPEYQDSNVTTGDYTITEADKDGYFRGWEDWRNGIEKCPYTAPSERGLAAAWHQGWIDAEWAAGQNLASKEARQ